MTWAESLLVLAACVAAFLVLGVWTAFALMTAGTILLALQGGQIELQALGAIAFNSNNNFLLSAVPLFVLMGQIILSAGLSKRFFATLGRMLEWCPGELLPGSIVACGLFAATTGSSVATAAAVGSVAMPEMKERGYRTSFAAGTIAAGGSLGNLIPPSVALIIYSSLENVSITQLFAAGLLPAVTMALVFTIYVMIRVTHNPRLVDDHPDTGELTTASARPAERHLALAALTDVVPVLLLILLVLGSIYDGIATPTEAASLAVLGATLISLPGLSWRKFYNAANRSVRITVMLFAIILGGQIMSDAIVSTGVAQQVVSFAIGHHVGSIELLIVMSALFILLGDFVEGVGMMLITIPIVFPIFLHDGFNPVLLGVLVAILVELGQITPPVGLNLFVLRGFEPSLTQGQVIRAALPFAGLMIGMLVLITAVPNIALWLPGHIGLA